MEQSNNYKTIMRIVGAVVFVLLFLLVYSKIYNVFRYKDTHGDYLSMPVILKDLPKDSLDVAFVGSSHTVCGVLPAVIWEETGISSMNVGISGMDKSTCIATLNELFKYQSPQVVLVDLYNVTFDEHAVEGNVVRAMFAYEPFESKGLPVLDKDRMRLIDDEIRINGDSDRYELADANDYYLEWPIVHSRYQELKANDFRENPRYEYWLGEEPVMRTSLISPPELYSIPPEAYILSDENKEYIDEVIRIVESNGSQVVFTIIPYPDYSDKDFIQFMSADSYIRGMGYNIINGLFLQPDIGYSYDTDFFNGDHLNYWGAKKVSGYLANYLMMFYELEDHRDDPKYMRWEKNWEYMHQMDQKWDLQNDENGAFGTVIRSSLGSNLCTIIKVTGDLSPEGSSSAIAYAFGISEADLAKGGAWIIDSGEKVARYLPGNGEEIEYEVNKNLSVKICDSKDDKTDIYFNLDRRNMINSDDESGLEIFVYDEVLDEMIYNGVIK